MSFILDALRKAERDKQRGSAPNMHDVMHSPPAPAGAGSHRLPWILVAIVLALFALVLWLLPETQRRMQEDQKRSLNASQPDGLGNLPSPVPTVSTAELPAGGEPEPSDWEDAVTATQVAAEPVQGDATETQSTAADPNPPEDEPIMAESFEDLIGEDEPTAASGQPAAKPSPPPAVAEPSSPSAAAAASPSPSRGEVESAPSGNAAPGPQTLTDRGEPRLLADMPDDFRASFPEIQVDVHVYDADPSRRWLLISGKRYAEGENLPGGAVIEEIVSDGVLVRFRGETVRVQVVR